MKKSSVNIAIVGLGNIGCYLYNYIQKNKNNILWKTGKLPIIKYISAKNLRKKRPIKFSKSQWVNNPLDITKKNVDIIIELIGGSDGIAKKLVFLALKNKKHVITANKSLMAKYGNDLSMLAEKNKVNLEYEASVAGGIPILRAIKEGLIANKINRIYGILNGTTNFILSKMEKSGKKFNEVISEAKSLGYAENNPKSDINGEDVASKLKILSSISFNTFLPNKKTPTKGIEEIEQADIINAKNLGFKIKLLGISEIKNNKLFERVYPCLISNNSYIANVDGVTNAVIIDGSLTGKSILQGDGAGAGPTTSALISDLCSILRGNIKYPFGISNALRKKIVHFNFLNYECSQYIRLEVNDKSGVLSSITKIFAKYKISLKRLIQIPNKKTKSASIIIITHKAKEKNFVQCLKSLLKNNSIIKKPISIRIEDL